MLIFEEKNKRKKKDTEVKSKDLSESINGIINLFVDYWEVSNEV